MAHETRYSLKELTAMMKEKTVVTSSHRHPGTVIRCELAVSNNGARLIRTAQFPVGEGNDFETDEVTSVL